MATFTATPASVGDNDAWSNSGGANKTASVAANDGDTSFIYTSSGSARQDFQTDAASLPFQGVTGSVTTYSVHKSADSGAASHPHMKLGASYNDGSNVTRLSYTSDNLVSASPPGGGSWTDADVKSLLLGVTTSAGTTTQERCTHIYATFTADFVSAGFVSLLAQLLGAAFPGLVGAGFSIKDFFVLMRDPKIARKVVLAQEEFRERFSELRAHPFPRYFILEAA